MTDLENVLKGLEQFKSDFKPYVGNKEDWSRIDAAIYFLKEQEAVEPILKREGRNKYYNYYVCPCCDEEVVYDQNYCSECGAKFMWEGR